MVGLCKGNIDDFDAVGPMPLKPLQLRAAAAPHLPISELAKDPPPPPASGNFKDLESLLDQLGSTPVFELGNPLPQERFMPKRRIGGCPASHNRALLDEDAD